MEIVIAESLDVGTSQDREFACDNLTLFGSQWFSDRSGLWLQFFPPPLRRVHLRLENLQRNVAWYARSMHDMLGSSLETKNEGCYQLITS